MPAQGQFSQLWEDWTMLYELRGLWFVLFVLNARCRNANAHSVCECFQTSTRGQSCSPGPESLQNKASTYNPSFPGLTMSLRSLNVKSFNALLKILSLWMKPAYMKSRHSLEGKAW